MVVLKVGDNTYRMSATPLLLIKRELNPSITSGLHCPRADPFSLAIQSRNVVRHCPLGFPTDVRSEIPENSKLLGMDPSSKVLIYFSLAIEYGIFGEGSQISSSTNQKRESTVSTLLIG